MLRPVTVQSEFTTFRAQSGVEPKLAGIAPPPIILLVEDDVDTREMYRVALEYEGYWVVDASSVAEALASASLTLPDLVIADIGLRGEADGVGLVRELQGNRSSRTTQVIALTSRDLPASHAALFDKVLLKPVLPDELIEHVRDTCRPALFGGLRTS